MKKINQKDISQEVFDLYDDYAHNKIETEGSLKNYLCLL
jgi:hypothetical protein